MHEKYAQQGLACLSVCVDKREKSRDALKFLKEQKAVFANYLLDETAQVWQDRWEIDGPPCVFVFDRHNRRAGKLDSFDDAEPLVQKLLVEKPESP
jgi:hypothetical protein